MSGYIHLHVASLRLRKSIPLSHKSHDLELAWPKTNDFASKPSIYLCDISIYSIFTVVAVFMGDLSRDMKRHEKVGG
jgi:hypothetical protein